MNQYFRQKARFTKFHNENPHIYQMFETYSLEAYRAGHWKFSHWLIVNRIRWDSMVQTTGDKYKIPNEYIGFYARLFMAKNPTLLGFFRIKPMKDEPYDEYFKTVEDRAAA